MPGHQSLCDQRLEPSAKAEKARQKKKREVSVKEAGYLGGRLGTYARILGLQKLQKNIKRLKKENSLSTKSETTYIDRVCPLVSVTKQRFAILSDESSKSDRKIFYADRYTSFFDDGEQAHSVTKYEDYSHT